MPPLSEASMTTTTDTILYRLNNSANKKGNQALVETVFSDFQKLLAFLSLYRSFAFVFFHVIYFLKADTQST